MRQNRLLHLLPFILLFVLPISISAQAWQQYASPEDAGWSSDKIEEAWKYADEIGSAAFMLIHDGKIVATHGDVTRRFMCHSVRKSLLTSLYGIYVDAGKIDLDVTIKDLGIDDVHNLTDVEKSATIRHLLQARSGVYHPAAYETEAMKKIRPARESHKPGTFWYYNNWDFNTSCAILMQKSGKDFFEDFEEKLAIPLGMEDFRLDDTYYHLEAENSKFPAYPFRMSARDLARVGQLYLQKGMWNGKQLLSENWIAEATKTYSFNTRTEGRGYAYMWWTGIYGKKHPNYSMQGVGNQSVIVFPKENVVMVNRTNTFLRHSVETDDLVRLTEMLWEAKIGKVKEGVEPKKVWFEYSAPPKSPAVMSRAQMNNFVGTFNLENFSIEVVWKENQLMAKTPTAGNFYVFPIDEETLMAQDAWFQIKFRKQPDGKLAKKVEMVRDPNS
jgi:CubicO group peptidase (beta-lactamase class C family)